MCLGVPGQILEIREDPTGMHMARVSFGGIVKEVCLAYTPEAEVGDYVVVHVGFAISRSTRPKPTRSSNISRRWASSEELDVPQPGDIPDNRIASQLR